MGKKHIKSIRAALFVVVLVFPMRAAAQSSSANYSIEESAFSTGSQLDAASASYSARLSAGDLGVGFSESGNYLAFAGPISPDEEFIELVIPVQTIDLGVLDPGVAGTGTATFSARGYLNDSYIIVSLRDPPTSEGGSQLDPITSAAPFDANTEQFGMNLVANTAPVAQGANPSRLPVDNGFFSFGEAAPGYNTANNYQYNAADTIARSTTRGYGETDYTISYIANITSITPAGTYRMEQDLVILGTF